MFSNTYSYKKLNFSSPSGKKKIESLSIKNSLVVIPIFSITHFIWKLSSDKKNSLSSTKFGFTFCSIR